MTNSEALAARLDGLEVALRERYDLTHFVVAHRHRGFFPPQPLPLGRHRGPKTGPNGYNAAHISYIKIKTVLAVQGRYRKAP
jgi:hypothetical protein